MSRSGDSLFESASPLRFLLILVPFVAASVIGFCTMGTTDTAYAVWWAFVLMLFGLVTLPLATKLWERFSSGGFFLSQPMGLILTCLVLWTLGHLKLFRINLLCIILSALIVGALCYIPKTFRESFIKKLNTEGFIFPFIYSFNLVS